MAFVNISGATSNNYTLVTADLAAQMRCVVTATNSAGSASANAAQVGPVTAPPDPPANTVLPAISGTTAVGSTLTTTDGTWTGTATISFAYQWKRGGVNISGATASSYPLVTADLGAIITVTVTGTNSAGNSSSTSIGVGPITASAGPSGWSRVPLGPGGFISGIDAHADGTKICRMDTSGAYKYNTTTSRWEMMVTTYSIPGSMTTPGYGANTGAYELCIAKTDANRIYMAWQHLAEFHVMRSNDKGVTFTPTNFWAQNPTATWDSNDGYRGSGKKMVIDPINPDVVFLSSHLGVHYTLDGGSNWTTISTSQIPASSSNSNLLAFDPNSTTSGGRKQTIYAFSYGNGLYRSINGGAAWALVTGGGPTTVYDLKIASNGTVWVVKYPISYEMDIFRLVGSTWTTWTTGVGSDGGYQMVGMAIDPANDSHVVTVTEMGSLSSSYDNGATWTGYGLRHTDWAPITWLNSIYGGAGDYGLSPGATLLFDPSLTNTLLLGTGLGVVTGTAPPSSASGLSFTMAWTGNSVGLEQLCAKRLLKPHSNSAVILGVMDQGIFNCDGVSYPTYKGIMPYFSACWDADWCPADPLTIIAILNETRGGPEDQSGMSRDGGATWTPWYGTSLNAPYHMPYGGRVGGQIACGATRDNFMIIAMKNKPNYTTTGGASWAQCTFPPDFPQVIDSDQGWSINYYDQRHTICGDRVTANKFYARNGWSDKFYVSTDAGATFNALPNPSMTVFTGPHARLQAVPGNAGHLFYTPGSSGNTNAFGPFIRSIDGGINWTQLGTVSSGPYEVICLGFGKPAPAQTYPAIYIIGWVSGVYGIYRSDDSCATWVNIGDFPLGCFDTPVDITGDPDVYGTCYTSIGASGIFKYVP